VARLISSPIRNKTTAICRLCTKEGTLEETYVNKAVDKPLYKYSAGGIWGQRFKVHLDYGSRLSPPPAEEGLATDENEDNTDNNENSS